MEGRVRFFGDGSCSTWVLVIQSGPGVETTDAAILDMCAAIPALCRATVVVPPQRAMVEPLPWHTDLDISDMEALRGRLRVRRWDLVVGRSWGASLGLLYATRHARRVRRVVAVSPSSLRVAPSLRPVYGALYVLLHRSDTAGAALAEYEKRHPSGWRCARQKMLRARIQTYYRWHDFFVAAPPGDSKLFARRPRSDIVVLTGDADEALHAEDALFVSRWCRLVVLRGVGHELNADMQRATNEVIAECLTRR